MFISKSYVNIWFHLYFVRKCKICFHAWGSLPSPLSDRSSWETLHSSRLLFIVNQAVCLDPQGLLFCILLLSDSKGTVCIHSHALFWVNTLTSCSTWLYGFIIIPQDFAATKTQKVVHVQWNKGGTISFLPGCLVFYLVKQPPIQKQSKGFINFIYLSFLCSSIHWINNLLTILIEKHFTRASSSRRSEHFLTWFIYCYDYISLIWS